MLRFITAIWKLMCKGEIQPLQSMLSWEKDLPIIKGGVSTGKSFIIIYVSYTQFQGEKLRKSIACANLYRLRKRFHYWFCCLFVVFSTNPVLAVPRAESLRDRQRSNALRNFWLVHFLKFNNNIADDCNRCFITDVRENLHSLTNWFHNKTHTQKKLKLTLSATNISNPIFSSPAQKCSMVSWCRLQEFSSPWWLPNY